MQEGGGPKKQAEKRERKDRFIKQDYPINGKMASWPGCKDGWGEWETSPLSFSIYEAKQWRCLQRGWGVCVCMCVGRGVFIITRVPLPDKWDFIYLTSADLFQ